MDGDANWLFSDGDYGHNEFYNSIDTVIMGRKTFEKALQLEEDPLNKKDALYFQKIPIFK